MDLQTIGKLAKQASYELAITDSNKKNAALEALLLH